MPEYIPWNSQPLDSWARQHAEGRFVDLDGRRTHYIEKGAGEPIILLHGYFFDSYLWAANMDVLAQQFKVYALDLWGFGYSTREPLNYGYQLYSDQVLLFMDKLGIQRASLVGQSMGGGTAIAMDVAKMTIIGSDLLKIPQAIRLSRQTVATIRQNLFWAFIYNTIGIPIAAGILFPFNGFLLNPMIAGAAMALSSLSVVGNSLLLKRKPI